MGGKGGEGERKRGGKEERGKGERKRERENKRGNIFLGNEQSTVSAVSLLFFSHHPRHQTKSKNIQQQQKLTSRGKAKLMTVSTCGISKPRAATSVQSK